MAAPAGSTPGDLSYNLTEFVFGSKHDTDSTGVIKQAICMFNAPVGSKAIEEFVQSKNLGLPNVDWGYAYGKPQFHVKTTKRLTGAELDAIEQKIRDKGIETFSGGLPKLSYNLTEFVFGSKHDTDSRGVIKQAICMFNAPVGSKAIEEFVQSKNLGLPNVDWGYAYGKPQFHVKTTKRLAGAELDAIEQKIRDKGIETFSGGLPKVLPKIVYLIDPQIGRSSGFEIFKLANELGIDLTRPPLGAAAPELEAGKPAAPATEP